MFDDTVLFRKACEMDLNAIWDLLHANSKMITDDQILLHINQIYVLEYQKRILGILCGTYSGSEVKVLWMAIHPLYPEYSLQEAMVQQFTGIFCRVPGEGMKKNPLFNRFIKWFKQQPLKLFHNTEGAIDGVQDQ